MSDLYLTAKQLAAHFGGQIVPKTLSNWRSAGRGPPWRRIGGRVLYPVDALRQWEEEQTRHSAVGSAAGAMAGDGSAPDADKAAEPSVVLIWHAHRLYAGWSALEPFALWSPPSWRRAKPGVKAEGWGRAIDAADAERQFPGSTTSPLPDVYAADVDADSAPAEVTEPSGRFAASSDEMATALEILNGLMPDAVALALQLARVKHRSGPGVTA